MLESIKTPEKTSDISSSIASLGGKMSNQQEQFTKLAFSSKKMVENLWLDGWDLFKPSSDKIKQTITLNDSNDASNNDALNNDECPNIRAKWDNVSINIAGQKCD